MLTRLHAHPARKIAKAVVSFHTHGRVFDQFGGGSLGLVAWELGHREAEVAPAWRGAINRGLIEPVGIDLNNGEEMWRITEQGRDAHSSLGELCC